MTGCPRPALLCILDGWGWRPGHAADNAIAQGCTPNYTRLLAECPHALLQTSGSAVGLPRGQMGNSEVGHMNIGAGRVVAQDLPRIDVAIEDGSLARRPALLALIDKLKASKGAVHLMGLMSPGGVHSHQDHIAALVKIFAGASVPVFVHAFLDGRDTAPKSARGFIEKFLADIHGPAGVRLATLSGRYYAMDRDKRWDRVEKAYAALVDADARRFDDAFAALDHSYGENITDEFLLPCVLGDYAGMQDGDVLLFANFRADRAREISTALLDPGFAGFKRARIVAFAAAAGLTEYSHALKPFMTAIFAPEDVRETLGEVIAEHHMTQLRIAETEKYAHVTFFLNGGREDQFAGEDRILVPSPKVATYDHKPEMSACQVTEKLEEAIGSGKYDLIVCNYANPDMVGHTGVMAAAVKAVDTIDECLGRLRTALEKAGGLMLLTADHGNIEMMEDPKTHEPYTAHTTLDVPIIALGAPEGSKLNNGRLADVAPTMLDLMGLEKPGLMTGHSLLVREA
ncbi:MAG TPA: 2,3-bisphosphoglycerate-independent phosphoglycerate mutase [Rhizomicrobium sp.]|jgi:2,3-bisphosphoglycerate-independent phosphoglycerate mutase|nr:2,3-bisphosphoglycerate-independent phosphoglycerate mutase [Rhizomicrobium sp.]